MLEALKNIYRKKWTRRVLYVLAAGVAYQIFIMSLPWMIDLRAKRKMMELQANAALKNTAAVTIPTIDADLSIGGTVLLEMKHAEMEAPNIEFAAPCISIERTRIRASLWQILGFEKLSPEIEIRKGTLRLAWDQFGSSNLAGLCDPVDVVENTAPSPDNIEKLDIKLNKCRVLLKHGKETIEVPLSGEININPKGRKISGNIRPADFHRDGSPFPSQIIVPDFSLSITDKAKLPVKLENCVLLVNNFSLDLIRMFWPRMPHFRRSQYISGKLKFHSTGGTFFGSVLGLNSKALGLSGKIKLECSFGDKSYFADISGIPGISMIASSGTEELLRLNAEFGEKKDWGPISLKCKTLNLDQLPDIGNKNSWLEPLFRITPEVIARAENLQIFGMPIKDATLVASPSKNGINITVDGTTANGELTLKISDWENQNTMPREFKMEIKNADLEKILAITEKRFGVAQKLSNISGKCSLTISGTSPTERKNTGERWKINIKISDAIVGANNIFAEELAMIPSRLGDAENMRLKALQKKVSTTVSKMIPEFSIKSMNGMIQIYDDGAFRFQVLGAKSAELGRIALGGSSTKDGTVKTAVSVINPPESFYKYNPNLSPEIIAIAKELASKNGLRLDILYKDGKLKTVRNYIQQVFKAWTDKQAKE